MLYNIEQMKLKTIQLLIPLISLLIILEVVVLIKFRYYPEWNITSYLTSYQNIGLFTSLFAPTLYLFISAYKKTDTKTFLTTYIRNKLKSKKTAIKSLITTFSIFILFLIPILSMGESQYLEKITFYLKNHNWEYAEKELENVKEDNIRPDVFKTYELFLITHQESDVHNFPNGKTLRSRKNAVEDLITNGFDYQLMNTLTLAELHKSLFFVEDDMQHILDAQEILDGQIETVPILLKKGELHLGMKNYSKAKGEFEKALTKNPNNSEKSIMLCNLGNIAASDEDYKYAINNYKQAENNYPEIRKFIFYSNFGYLLMLNGDYNLAEKKVIHALKINPDDWYSYLNLGLVQERLKRYQDAIHSFDIVISKTDNIDSKREAGILKGRLDLQQKSGQLVKRLCSWILFVHI